MAKKFTRSHHKAGSHSNRDYRIILNNQFIILLTVGIVAISVAFLYINNFNMRPKAMESVDSGGGQEQTTSEDNLQDKYQQLQQAQENIDKANETLQNIMKKNNDAEQNIINNIGQ